MSAATIASQAQGAGQCFLRWSDGPELPVREEPVEVVGVSSSEPLIRSALMVIEETKVFLIGSGYSGNGIVRSCQKEGNSFLLTIGINTESMQPELPTAYDPGLFAIDDFLTEEDEDKILASLNNGSDLEESGCY